MDTTATTGESIADLSPADIALEAAIVRAEAAIERLLEARARLWAWAAPKVEHLH